MTLQSHQEKRYRIMTIAELAKIVGISDRKIKTNLARLKAKGMLRRIGPDKGGHWIVINEQRK